MRMLVIGQSGQVAQSLLERGAVAGVEVVARGRPETDLTDAASLEAALAESRPDVVVNAAAYTAVDAAEDDEDAAHALNATGPGLLAGLCAARDIPFIHISTDYVFDGAADRPYREDDQTGPQSAYGRTKLAGERAVLSAGGRALVLRTAWVYSPFGKNFVKTMLRVGAERDELKVVSDQRGNPTSALDIADGILALCGKVEAWPEAPAVFHMSAGGEASWHEFAEAIFAVDGGGPRVLAIGTADYPTPARRPANSRLDGGRLGEALGVRLPDWRESLPGVVARIKAGG